jgi:hypothetical protein
VGKNVLGRCPPPPRAIVSFMADHQQLALLQQGAEVWNQWRKETALILNLRNADLSGADLRNANLSGAVLHGANLREANLHGADLYGAGLHRTNLHGADLYGSILRRANLREADLSEANLSDANLSIADLRGADLSGANLSRGNLVRANLNETNLSGANLNETPLYETYFVNTNLRNVHGLDTCVHHGPSTIDHRTLALSGPLPLLFLRGCGLPEVYISYLPSLREHVIQFDSCFISYSAKDHDFAERIYEDLQNRGVRCWFAPHKIQGGKKIHEQIDTAIQMHDRLLLILSDSSMESEWVKTEISKARNRELREKRRMLFPIRLVSVAALRDWECFDADSGKDSAREIREYYVPDFSNWKQRDTYQVEFEKLLRDLRQNII